MSLVLARIMLVLFLMSIKVPADASFGNFNDDSPSGDISSGGAAFVATTFLGTKAGELGTTTLLSLGLLFTPAWILQRNSSFPHIKH